MIPERQMDLTWQWECRVKARELGTSLTCLIKYVSLLSGTGRDWKHRRRSERGSKATLSPLEWFCIEIGNNSVIHFCHRYGGGRVTSCAVIGSVLVSQTPVCKFGGIDIFNHCDQHGWVWHWCMGIAAEHQPGSDWSMWWSRDKKHWGLSWGNQLIAYKSPHLILSSATRAEVIEPCLTHRISY